MSKGLTYEKLLKAVEILKTPQPEYITVNLNNLTVEEQNLVYKVCKRYGIELIPAKDFPKC